MTLWQSWVIGWSSQDACPGEDGEDAVLGKASLGGPRWVPDDISGLASLSLTHASASTRHCQKKSRPLLGSSLPTPSSLEAHVSSVTMPVAPGVLEREGLSLAELK